MQSEREWVEQAYDLLDLKGQGVCGLLHCRKSSAAWVALRWAWRLGLMAVCRKGGNVLLLLVLPLGTVGAVDITCPAWD